MSWRDKLRDLDPRRWREDWVKDNVRLLFILGVVFGIVVMVGAGAVFDSGVETTGTIPLQTNSGVTVKVSGAGYLNGTEFPGDNQVRVVTDKGNATFGGAGTASADVDAGNLTGEWTNVTNLDVSSNELWINPEDKHAANVSGDAANFAFRSDISAIDDEPDFVYAGASGTTSVTIRGLAPNVNVLARDQSDTILTSGNTGSDGVVTLSGMENSKHVVTLETGEQPFVETADPSGNEYFDDRSVDLNATVIDPKGNDFVSVEIQTFASGSWTTETTETSLPSGSEINASITAHPGQNKWRVIMNASGDRNVTSSNFTFRTPGVVTIFNGTSETKLTPTTVTGEVTSTENTSTFKDSLTTTTGVADLVDINPPDEIFVSEWSASGFDNQTLMVRKPSSNYTVVLYETGNSDTYTQCFGIDDPTGTFTRENSWVVIEEYIDGDWETVGSERFGVENEAEIVLDDGTDYRVKLRNEDGDLRAIGGFTGDSTNNCVTLTVTSSVGTPEQPDTVAHNVSCIQGDPKQVKFEYNDTLEQTSEINLLIHQYQNESNVLLSNTTFTGTFGEFSYTATVPTEENDTEWVIDAVAVRDDAENVQVQRVVCGQRDILPDMPPWLITFTFVGLIWITAGLFSQLNGAVGGVVVAGMGGMFWLSGLAPAYLGGGVVALSMLTAGVLFIRERRAGGL